MLLTPVLYVRPLQPDGVFSESSWCATLAITASWNKAPASILYRIIIDKINSPHRQSVHDAVMWELSKLLLDGAGDDLEGDANDDDGGDDVE